MLNVPLPVPETCAIVGAAVRVNGPAVGPVAVLLTVMVAFLVVVKPVFMAGDGAENATVADNTWNVTGLGVPLAVPPGVDTVTVLAVVPAAAVITQLAFTVIAVGAPVIVQVTPVPDTLTAVTPAKPLPVIVTGTVVPRTPVFGLIEVSDGASTVKSTTLLGDGFAVLTVTNLVLRVAFAAIVNVAVTVESLTITKLLTATPVPDTAMVFVVLRLVPVNVTFTALPRAPEVGLIEVSVGAGTPTAPWTSTAPMST